LTDVHSGIGVELELVGDILHARFSLEDLELETVQELISRRKRIIKGKPFGVLVERMDVKRSSREARECLGSAESLEDIEAAAIVVDSPFKAGLVNYFLKMAGPEFPTRMFTNRKQAERWLTKQIQ